MSRHFQHSCTILNLGIGLFISLTRSNVQHGIQTTREWWWYVFLLLKLLPRNEDGVEPFSATVPGRKSFLCWSGLGALELFLSWHQQTVARGAESRLWEGSTVLRGLTWREPSVVLKPGTKSRTGTDSHLRHLIQPSVLVGTFIATKQTKRAKKATTWQRKSGSSLVESLYSSS